MLPHSDAIASKLAQCLNPALPSGVHQKALEVYVYIFSTFGVSQIAFPQHYLKLSWGLSDQGSQQSYLANHLHEFLPGLSPVLSFASYSIRPGLYKILEDFVLHLPATDLRHLLKSLILSLLPALEEETSEDFHRAFRIVESLERIFSNSSESAFNDNCGYFWQCLFLAVITNPCRRQGSLNYLAHKLPSFTQTVAKPSTNSNGKLTPAAEAVVSPEPGLLIRAFICGLSDPEVLIQRGFLDLLVTNLPLNSPLLQARARKDDLDRLTIAATQVLLRREMSLNRRLWSWFLGPDPKTTGSQSQPSSPDVQRRRSADLGMSSQFKYFSAYGKATLERCVLAMFVKSSVDPKERARPFRICLSLMDRWEIGGSIVPHMFLPAIESMYRFSLNASQDDVSEVLRSASIFFDGVEASLIWGSLLSILERALKGHGAEHFSLDFFTWIIHHFNVKEEEMLMTHIPLIILYALACIEDSNSTKYSPDLILAVLDVVLELTEMVPERALFGKSREAHLERESSSPAITSLEARSIIESFYNERDQAHNQTPPLSSDSILHLLCTQATSVTLEALREEQERKFCRAVLILLTLHSKLADPTAYRHHVPTSIFGALIDATRRPMKFAELNSVMSLLASLNPPPEKQSSVVLSKIVALEPAITAQVWKFLSPSFPKYHVEAVRLIWQMKDLVGPEDCLEASLTELMRNSQVSIQGKDDERAEAVRRFSVLWAHTIPTQLSNAKLGAPCHIRRGSTVSTVSDTKDIIRRQRVLKSPLMLMLDILQDSHTAASNVVATWIQNLPTLEQVLSIHFDLMFDTVDKINMIGNDAKPTSTDRHTMESFRDLEYVLSHFQIILKHSNDWIWQCLREMRVPVPRDDIKSIAVVALAEYSCQVICSDELSSPELERIAVDILWMMVSGPAALSLKPLELDSRVMVRMMSQLSDLRSGSQALLLKIVTRSLKLRLTEEATDVQVEFRKSSISVKRSSIAESRPSPNISGNILAVQPPPQLLDFIRTGFSATAARANLDQWLEFISEILPVFADAIFASLIPLVECLCDQLNKLHAELVSMSTTHNLERVIAPESTAMALLEALEMVLARAHSCLAEEHNGDQTPRPNSQSRGLFGNVTSGVFKAEGPPSKTSQANSRLTVVLTFQDAIRVAMKMWTWASHTADVDAFDKVSASTTSFNALKVRNRTRHLLEQIFTVEPLGSLEVVMSRWNYSGNATEAAASLNLLHVMQGSRPKNTVPAILDALCSRTNPTALPLERQSSQTVHLTALDVALFLSAYVQSTEDDAMDEIWSDCIAFLRDVLANPLPYRHVLPAMLSIILLLFQKVDNTNFGEQKKMRRDLGDIFLRLLAATLTAVPPGYPQESSGSGIHLEKDNYSDSVSGRNTMSLFVVLKRVTANIETILGNNDRATTAINNMTTNLVAPLLRARLFPGNITTEVLQLLLQLAKSAPLAKAWKKEVLEAFNDPRTLTSPLELIENDWFPVFHQWCLHDKERMPEMLSRLNPPSSAGIMFGVGASAARLEADRKTQLNLRRISILLLSCPEDTFAAQHRVLEEKLVELFGADPASSPSSMIKPELFMLCRALILSTSAVQLSPMWPVINDNLQAALAFLIPNSSKSDSFGNLSLLQACKLLDLLVAISPDEFQLHEWLYITDTIDAVYKPTDWSPTALSDQLAEALASEGVEEADALILPTPFAGDAAGRRHPLIDKDSIADTEDVKAMARDDFARTLLRPFLSQLSIHAYEGVYSMDTPSSSVCRRGLLRDLVDLTTIVE